jgi:hypothetical protein
MRRIDSNSSSEAAARITEFLGISDRPYFFAT